MLLHSSEVLNPEFSFSGTSLPRKAHRCGSALLQSARVLSEHCYLGDENRETGFVAAKSWIRKCQARFVEHRHLRKQDEIHGDAAAAAASNAFSVSKTSFLHLSKRCLRAPNKMLLQGYVSAHQQQAHHDRLHALHESPFDAITAASLDAFQNFEHHRKAKKEARLAAKYAAIETLEDRAFQICKDLGMI